MAIALATSRPHVWSQNTNNPGAIGLHSENNYSSLARNCSFEHQMLNIMDAIGKIHRKDMRQFDRSRRKLEQSLLAYSEKMKPSNKDRIALSISRRLNDIPEVDSATSTRSKSEGSQNFDPNSFSFSSGHSTTPMALYESNPLNRYISPIKARRPSRKMTFSGADNPAELELLKARMRGYSLTEPRPKFGTERSRRKGVVSPPNIEKLLNNDRDDNNIIIKTDHNGEIHIERKIPQVFTVLPDIGGQDDPLKSAVTVTPFPEFESTGDDDERSESVVSGATSYQSSTSPGPKRKKSKHRGEDNGESPDPDSEEYEEYIRDLDEETLQELKESGEIKQFLQQKAAARKKKGHKTRKKGGKLTDKEQDEHWDQDDYDYENDLGDYYNDTDGDQPRGHTREPKGNTRREARRNKQRGHTDADEDYQGNSSDDDTDSRETRGHRGHKGRHRGQNPRSKSRSRRKETVADSKRGGNKKQPPKKETFKELREKALKGSSKVANFLKELEQTKPTLQEIKEAMAREKSYAKVLEFHRKHLQEQERLAVLHQKHLLEVEKAKKNRKHVTESFRYSSAMDELLDDDIDKRVAGTKDTVSQVRKDRDGHEVRIMGAGVLACVTNDSEKAKKRQNGRNNVKKHSLLRITSKNPVSSIFPRGQSILDQATVKTYAGHSKMILPSIAQRHMDVSMLNLKIAA